MSISDYFNGNPTLPQEQDYVLLDKETLLGLVAAILSEQDSPGLKERARLLKEAVESLDSMLVNTGREELPVRVNPFLEEIQQILDAYTYERSRYYAERLQKGLVEAKTNDVNDINLRRWKDYDEVFTDSLWSIDRRDQSGAHLGWYWGNYVPQIPHQLMLRYSKLGDLVIDPFLGSGTTLIECRRLGRNGVGVEISPSTAVRARELVEIEENPYNVTTLVEVGDSQCFEFRKIIEDMGRDTVDLFLMHPPYHDIIQFTSDPNDLSNARNTDSFLDMFGHILDNTIPFLRKGRYAGIVIGDKYSQGEWIPLGFYCMQKALSRGLKLKSIIVKNFDETKGKRNQKALWRYRALQSGFYVFKHEYILILEKR
ncbi:MAG: DNA methyltransferase [Firmicutes bacterium]|nr:DNA methyltransferase [Bacillota bacterium]MBV1726532.1 DNA methyltransferase [Desulforudis sp.]MBV1735233.1 DNA methyltransferase [Desulforudis sp.]